MFFNSLICLGLETLAGRGKNVIKEDSPLERLVSRDCRRIWPLKDGDEALRSNHTICEKCSKVEVGSTGSYDPDEDPDWTNDFEEEEVEEEEVQPEEEEEKDLKGPELAQVRYRSRNGCGISQEELLW